MALQGAAGGSRRLPTDLNQLGLRANAAWRGRELREQGELARGEPQLDAVEGRAAPAAVDRERANRCRGECAVGPAGDCIAAGAQLLRAGAVANDAVGAGVERRDG